MELSTVEREYLALGRAINRAAAELPTGWEVRVEVECDAVTVRLCDPDGAERMMDSGDTCSADVNAAVDMALAEAAKAPMKLESQHD